MTIEEDNYFGISKRNVARSILPAVTGVDYSARIHSVDYEQNPRFFELLKQFELRTGCGVLVSHPFKSENMPPVCSPEDSYLCFMRTEIDILVIEDCLLVKGEQPKFP